MILIPSYVYQVINIFFVFEIYFVVYLQQTLEYLKNCFFSKESCGSSTNIKGAVNGFRARTVPVALETFMISKNGSIIKQTVDVSAVSGEPYYLRILRSVLLNTCITNFTFITENGVKYVHKKSFGSNCRNKFLIFIENITYDSILEKNHYST